jgi:hypothetical protein
MKKLPYFLATVCLMLCTSPIFAQLVDPGDDPDLTGAPIGDYIWVVALVGFVFVFLRLRSFIVQANSK